MAIAIKLKSDVSSALFSDKVSVDGIEYNHTGLICLTPPIKSKLGSLIKVVGYNYLPDGVDNPQYGTFIFVSVDEHLPIHPEWVESVEGEPLRSPITLSAASSYIPLTASKAYSLETRELVSTTTIPVCTECGAFIGSTSEIKVCDSCLTTKFYSVRNHSYRPDYKFYGSLQGTHAKTNPTWYGIELEYGLNSTKDMAKLCYHHPELYLKSDSSISGGNHQVELVTHPATFEYLTSPSSWVHKVNSLDVENRPLSNGCHIHVSRTAFKDDRHYAKFKYLLQANLELLQLIGGRSLTQYCQAYAPLKRLLQTGKDSKGGERYRVINENNDATFELRFMASTNKSKQLLRYIEFVDSLIKYTAYHYNTATLKAYFNTYLTKYKEKYPTIYKYLSTRTDKLVGAVEYRDTEKVNVPLHNATVAQLEAAISVTIPGRGTMQVKDEASQLLGMNSSGAIVNVCGYSLEGADPKSVFITYSK